MPTAHFGNKHAAKHDYEALAKNLLEWSKNDDAMHLFEWCEENDFYSTAVSDFSRNSPAFAEAAKTAKMRIAIRLRNRLHSGDYNYGLFQRELSLYDHFVLEHERAEKKFDAQLKAAELAKYSEEDKEILQMLMKQIDDLLKENKVLKAKLNKLKD